MSPEDEIFLLDIAIVLLVLLIPLVAWWMAKGPDDE